MSYIPKYILKRMFPADSVKLVEGGLEISMLNVISPLSVEGIPATGVEDYVEFSIDGKPLDNAAKAKMKLTIGEGADLKSYTLAEAQKFDGVVVPVGGKMKIFVPASGLKVGEEHEFDLLVKTQNPFQLQVKRTIS
jgi:hypothetical protein